MKISIISPSLSGGGAEKVAVNLANYYSKKGFDVDLVLFQSKGEYLSQVNEGVNIVDLRIKPVRFVFGLYSIRPVRRYLIKHNPDAVLSVLRGANTILGLASKGLPKRKIIFREANTMEATLSAAWYKKPISLLIMRLAYKIADKIIANSEDTKYDLVFNKIIDKDKIVTIPNPVLPENFLDLSTRLISNRLFTENNKIIVSIGRLHPAKNFPLLIRAFKKVHEKDPATRLLIIGQGKEREALTTLIESLNLSDYVKIEGFKQNIYPYLAHARVFALASNWEGFGNVIVEALAMGKPVVCTNCPGGPKTILDNGKYGKLVPVENETLLAEAITESLNSKIDKKMLIKRGLQFSVPKIADEYLKHLLPDQE